MSEYLTRLNPKTQSFNVTSGKAELTTADIAAACTSATADDKTRRQELKLFQLGLSVALARICNDHSEQVKVFYSLLREVAGIAANQGWKIKKGSERLRGLTQLAVFETTNGQACPRCKGTKTNPRKPSEACTPCKGSGQYRLKDHDKALALGISKQAWSQTWSQRYYDVKCFVEDQEYSALKSIRDKLFSA